jgi:formate dehydrogenase subunit gamma
MTTTLAPPRVDRFDVVTRVAHWVTAVLVVVLVATGTILYVGPLSVAVGRRALLKNLHRFSGLLLPVPLAAGLLVSRWLRADMVTLGRWSDDDRRWLRRRTRRATTGRFNGGQKLVTALFGAGLAVQLMTGSIMTWPEHFPDDLRTGATFMHDWTYLALTVLVVAHVVQAFQHPHLLRAMLRGGPGGPSTR